MPSNGSSPASSKTTTEQACRRDHAAGRRGAAAAAGRLVEVDDRRLVKVSKYLAKHLRHRPERLGLSLDAHGWVAVGELLAAMAAHGMPLTRAELDEVVARNDKRRYAYDDTGRRIRASQGHSVGVDLGYEPAVPPDTLFHGTVDRAVPAIMAEGLRPRGRRHVHLSPDMPTARTVGARRGRPVVLAVDAGAMHAGGAVFVRSANDVWLVDKVPPQHLSQADPTG